MAKINTSQIEGFDSMDAEQLKAFIASYEFNDNAEALTKAKDALNKSCSEAAEYKKKLREKESAEETARREREEAEASRLQELENLKKIIAINDKTNQYLSLGFDAETAKATAEAEISGDTETVFKNHRMLIDKVKADVLAQVIGSQPKLEGGEPPMPKDTDEMTDAEYYASIKH